MTAVHDVIRCERFDLVLLTPSALEALLAGDEASAARLLDVTFPQNAWEPADEFVLRLRLEQVRADPACAPWLLRVLVAPDRTMIGHAGFHGPPGDDGWVELGYTVLEPYRRKGYAAEAATCMMRWAQREHGVQRFRVTISPANEPSLAMAAKLGFARTGEQIDEIDGLEYIFERQGAP